MEIDIIIDILVIGAEGAGCRVAIAAVDCGTPVLLASKKPLGKSGVISYPATEMVGHDTGDVSTSMDVQIHCNGIIEAGQGVTDEELAAIVASRAPETIRQLEEWGVKFEHENEGYYVLRSYLSYYPRTHVVEGHDESVVRAMKDQIRTRPNTTVMDDVTIMGLHVRDGYCVGVCGLAGREMVYINSKAVILISGGCGRAFEHNMSLDDVTDGDYSVAYHAGTDLVNMEFVQIGMGSSWPVVSIFNRYIWETKPRLSGREGKGISEEALPQGLTPDQMMHEHRKHFPLPSSDNSKCLEVAVQTTVRNERGTQRGGIRAGFSHITDEYVNSLKDDCGIHHMQPTARGYLRSRGVDLLLDQVGVARYVRVINGGVRTNIKGMSSIQGLCAAGEYADGPHGANRLGGSMVVTYQMLGEIADTGAAEYVLRAQHTEHVEYLRDPHTEEVKALLHWKLDCMGILDRLRKAAQDSLPVVRTEDGLTQASNVAGGLEGEMVHADTCQGIYPENIDLYHMLITVRIMARCTLGRRESRGPHHHAGRPFKNERFNKPVIIRRSG